MNQICAILPHTMRCQMVSMKAETLWIPIYTDNENQRSTKYWKRLKKIHKKVLVLITLTVYNDCG